MAAPEREQSPSVNFKIYLEAALAKIDRQLELNDENENVMERYRKHDELLEKRLELQTEIEELDTSQDASLDSYPTPDQNRIL